MESDENPTLQYQEEQDSVVTSSVEDPDPHDWIHIILGSWIRIRIKANQDQDLDPRKSEKTEALKRVILKNWRI